MSSAFKFKENEVKELKNQVKDLEQLKQSSISLEENLKTKEKEIKDFKLVISRLEHSLNEDKISTSKKIDTFLKEIGEKSQTIKKLTSQLKEMEILRKDYDMNKNEILDLKNQIVQSKKLMKEYELSRVDEQNRCIEELKLKSKEVSNLNQEVQSLQSTLKDNEKKCLDLQNYINEMNLKSNSLTESEGELKLKIIDYKKSNEELHDTIKLIKKENESVIKTMKIQLEENQLEFIKLNKVHQEMLSQLNEDKFNKISEERNIESVIKDFNLLTEENAFLKKERQKMLQTFHDMLNKWKMDFENLKSFVKEQLTEWSLLFIKQIKQLKAEYSTQITFYHSNLIETKEKLKSIQKAYTVLKSECVQSLEYFKIEIIEKYNENIITEVNNNNEELEKRKMDLVKLQEEIDRK